VLPVGFVIRIYHDAQSSESQNNEECSRNEVPYYILMISRAVTTTLNEAQLFH
jgi:hypothetical protein